MQKRRKAMALAGGVGILVGFIGGFAMTSVYARSSQEAAALGYHSVRIPEKGLPLINPLVAYETPESTSFTEYQQLKSRIERLIDTSRAAGKAESVSVYYRNQETGDWIGIDQNAYYYPASLLKVPAMIAYLKKAESDAKLLDKKITYQPVTGGDPFEAQSALVAGKSYSVNELIQRMIVDSDNGATYTLIDNIDTTTLNEVYSDLGITHPGEDTSTYQISTKTYALFFRVLFNATYLTPEYSEKALELLSEATYDEGVVAGIPAGTKVAHKFGEHVVSADRKTADGVELHDCGIVYAPDHPYLLCVMTKAPSVEDAQNLIQAVTKEVSATVTADAKSK
jgi:beta-lactamase class A